MEKRNALHVLRDDHKRLRGLLRQFEAVDERAHEMKAGVTREIFMELEIHSRIEEEIFYPALADAGDEGIKAMVEKSIESHKEVEGIIFELRRQNVDSVTYDPKFGELIDAVELHMSEEESDVFPICVQVLGGELDNVGGEMVERRQELLKLPKYRDALPEVVQNPNGGEQQRREVA